MHRHRFPADHALVDIGGAVDNLAVEGNFLARTHQHHVPGCHLIEGQFKGFTVALYPRGFGLQPDQTFDRL